MKFCVFVDGRRHGRDELNTLLFDLSKKCEKMLTIIEEEL